MVLVGEWDCGHDCGVEGVREKGVKPPRAAGPHAAGSPADALPLMMNHP